MSTLKSFSLLGFILLSTACGARSTSNNVGNGSNTNWLSGCNSDAKCGDDGVCAGGACTETCRSDDDCSHLHPDAKCAEAVTFVSSDSASCDDAAPRRVCTRGCEKERDCADIGDGFTCTSGECVPAACLDPLPTQPCEGLACGEGCDPCPPDDRDCPANAIVHLCNLDGECVPTDVACTDADCPNVSPDRCEEFGCVAIDGHAVTGECSDWTLKPVGCAPSDSGDSAISCALSPDDSLCYQFPTTTSPSGWETLSCEDARCVVPDCPDAECFSPTQNVDRAYDGDIPGCACDAAQGDVCVGRAGLICGGEDGKWRAVDDGPCYPIDIPCMGLLADPNDCIALFNLCVEQGDSFCGVSPLTAACPLGVIVDSETDCATDAAECTKLDDGLWCTSSVAAPGDECLSPTRNLDRAYDYELPGCPCNPEEGDLCIEGTGLMCYGGEWNAVIDGPCFPTASQQPCSGFVADPYECIALFDNCIQEGDLFCGVSPLTSQCADGIIVEDAAYCPPEATHCTQLANDLWCASPLESLCPEHYSPTKACSGSVFGCLSTSELILCTLRAITAEECANEGGESRADPGDGSVVNKGCGPDFEATAFISDFIDEGGLCCQKTSADAGAPDASTAE